MKKLLKILLIGVVIFILGWLGNFYWQNLRGAGVIVQSPTQPKEEFKTETNTTGLPLKLPEGFSISIFAKNLGGARVLTFDPKGNILISVPSEGKVFALIDKNKDGLGDENKVIVEDLDRPHGMAFRCLETCKLYIAETNQVAEYDYDKESLKAINKKKLFDLPVGGNHFTRTIIFEPYPNDSKMLISVGSSCNVCNENDSRRAKILEYDFNTKKLETFASGLRNSVFMNIHPVTGDMWATEMGRDLLGDDIPPDEINIIKKGKNYGWPICYGKNIHDDNFDKNVYFRNPCLEPFETESYIDIQAHSAPLGLAFFPEEGWPEEYWYNLLVSYHGSWNRSAPTGYKIVRYKLDEKGNYLGQADFISGWLDEKGNVYGRPVDILIQPNGIIYISDDKAGIIYKVIKN
ncbi:hypothetical protein A2645_00570 [Candidatus Nomurabacteria bacterium RIFCSPHIGHO2_01_FULL_39_9]|uniref:Pyrroloquinoline quinone-dependent pyranose dehydrogenase beta-propeller domain-containing protein n=1 Tax=Candidatus Nomurabacteria bacterium RIFCSPHIGHO2_01_FULL_39_9 TaxID=1801735 RepID=A0A1F6UWJ1_9BACT|nr:MAG: hypothetical protein A2645_00570 [Candidatus Nomurabacteria bacterium RIFCSPHIGHO2_01_FULL_39_9]